MEDIDFSIFRQNLRDLIETRGLLIKDAAEAIGVANPTMSRYLTGFRTPDLIYVARLAKYFSVSMDWLLGLNGDKFDVLPQEIQDLIDCYSIATPDDRQIIQAVLNKYRASDHPKVSYLNAVKKHSDSSSTNRQE